MYKEREVLEEQRRNNPCRFRGRNGSIESKSNVIDGEDKNKEDVSLKSPNSICCRRNTVTNLVIFQCQSQTQDH
jgi:hypothetical protein